MMLPTALVEDPLAVNVALQRGQKVNLRSHIGRRLVSRIEVHFLVRFILRQGPASRCRHLTHHVTTSARVQHDGSLALRRRSPTHNFHLMRQREMQQTCAVTTTSLSLPIQRVACSRLHRHVATTDNTRRVVVVHALIAILR
ncbi:hypothetical protein GQ600_14255 [Phytophthora cactorum]|nr:hypothetical protein GQ600_14255 [Phytophthora cactorum]